MNREKPTNEIQFSSRRYLFVMTITLTCLSALVTGLNFGSGGGLNYIGKRTPPDNTWFLSYTWEYLEHVIFYHNLGNVIENARKADVLILGNSRSLEGLDFHTARIFADKSKIRIFHLGLGWSETYALPLELIQKYDLHPKLVLINAEASSGGQWDAGLAPFFADGESKFASYAKSLNWLQALKYVMVGNIKWRIDSLRDYLPDTLNSVLPDKFYPETYLIYRSRQDGFWLTDYVVEKPKALKFVLNQNTCTVSPIEIKNAQKLAHELQSRGAKLILFLVPSPKSCVRGTEAIARESGLPLLISGLENLQEHGDGSHLTKASARRFSEDFFEKLEKNSSFRELFQRQEPNH